MEVAQLPAVAQPRATAAGPRRDDLVAREVHHRVGHALLAGLDPRRGLDVGEVPVAEVLPQLADAVREVLEQALPGLRL